MQNREERRQQPRKGQIKKLLNRTTAKRMLVDKERIAYFEFEY
jgi:hypothetical protein